MKWALPTVVAVTAFFRTHPMQMCYKVDGQVVLGVPRQANGLALELLWKPLYFQKNTI